MARRNPTAEAAIQALGSGAFTDSEPGPYRIIAGYALGASRTASEADSWALTLEWRIPEPLSASARLR